jgi:choline dehydrogenase
MLVIVTVISASKRSFIIMEPTTNKNPTNEPEAPEFEARVQATQRRLAAELQSSYDFIVCGSGSSGSVVARRLAESDDVSVLLLEAGGTDDLPSVRDAGQWLANVGTELDWGFQTAPNRLLNARRLSLSAGKVLGGSSSINAMIWSRGHKNDWEYFAEEAGDPRWRYESVLGLYRRLEDWQGTPDPQRRGKGGLVHVEPAREPNPIAPAMLEAARSLGIPTFDDQNGEMMEAEGGAAITNVRIRDGRRLSVFRSYTYPYMDRHNLTVLAHALVARIVFHGRRAAEVEFLRDGRSHRIAVRREIVLSLGAINTPKLLMQSGVGDESELSHAGIDVFQDLPGVGRNFRDHVIVPCVWQYKTPLPMRNSGGEATFFWKSDPSLDTPDLQPILAEVPFYTPETAHFSPPADSWSMLASLVRPSSRGHLRVAGPNPTDTIEIVANTLAASSDMKALIRAIELCREIGNSSAMGRFAKREVMPGNLTAGELESFARNAVSAFWHQACTAKMGRDEMSVVDGQLRVYGIDCLRIADASIMPRITTGNTMATCVVIGEQAADLIRQTYGI